MATYDRAILQQFADSLYAKASLTVLWYVLCFVIVGAILAYIGAQLAIPVLGDDNAVNVGLLGGALVLGLGLLGLSLGSMAAFQLRIQAQQNLWMLEVERKLAELSKPLTSARTVA